MNSEVFKSWNQFVAEINFMDEDTLKNAINFELANGGSKSIITRLHQRYCKLRNKREREELFANQNLS